MVVILPSPLIDQTNSCLTPTASSSSPGDWSIKRYFADNRSITQNQVRLPVILPLADYLKPGVGTYWVNFSESINVKGSTQPDLVLPGHGWLPGLCLFKTGAFEF